MGAPAPAPVRLPQRPGTGDRARSGHGRERRALSHHRVGGGRPLVGVGPLGRRDEPAARRAAAVARDRRARGIRRLRRGRDGRGRRGAVLEHRPVHRDLHGGRVGPEPPAGQHRARRHRRRHVRVAVLGARRGFDDTRPAARDVPRGRDLAIPRVRAHQRAHEPAVLRRGVVLRRLGVPIGAIPGGARAAHRRARRGARAHQGAGRGDRAAPDRPRAARRGRAPRVGHRGAGGSGAAGDRQGPGCRGRVALGDRVERPGGRRRAARAAGNAARRHRTGRRHRGRHPPSPPS